MRLGISSFTFTWAVGVPGHLPDQPLGPIDLVRRAAEWGVRVVQFGDNLPLHERLSREIRELGRIARTEGVSLEVGARTLDRTLLKRYVGLAAELGSPILRLVADPEGEPLVEAISHPLEPLLADLRAANIVLAIENHDRLTAAQLVALVERLGSECVGICLDTVNSFGALEGPRLVVEALAPYTVNLHLKDFTIFRAPQNMGFIIEGRPLGQGRLDIPWVLETLRAHGRDPNAILELWTPAQGTLEETVALERRWAEESVRTARRFISE